jgi:hypothetical protein
MSTVTEESRTMREWELRFPCLDDEWTHWWIEGDGALLAAVDGSDLRAALEVVRKHHDQCRSITVYRAKVDTFNEVVREESTGCEVAHRFQEPSTDVPGVGQEWRCCFCGRAIVESAVTPTFVRDLPDGGKQILRYHDECLRPLLHPSVPIAE